MQFGNRPRFGSGGLFGLGSGGYNARAAGVRPGYFAPPGYTPPVTGPRYHPARQSAAPGGGISMPAPLRPMEPYGPVGMPAPPPIPHYGPVNNPISMPTPLRPMEPYGPGGGVGMGADMARRFRQY